MRKCLPFACGWYGLINCLQLEIRLTSLWAGFSKRLRHNAHYVAAGLAKPALFAANRVLCRLAP
jgi:hypothetical protein